MDQGGELYKNPEVHKLFTEFHYDIRPTGAGASNQNGPAERGHLTVANAVRAMLKPLGWILHARHARRMMGHHQTCACDLHCVMTHMQLASHHAHITLHATTDDY